MPKIMKAVIFKNIALIAILAFAYPWIRDDLNTISDTETLKTLLVFVGLLFVAPLFANFTFSYEHIKKSKNIWLGHFTAFAAMLVAGLLLIMLDILLVKLVGNVTTLRLTIIVLWILILSYDFWDFLRIKNEA
jgi:hypothetical protein